MSRVAISPRAECMNRSPEHKIDSLAREAEVYFSSGDYLKALKARREILGLDPESALGHGLAGRAHLGLGQFAESRQHFEKALSFDPTESSRHYFIAVAHRYLGSFKKAEEHVRKAIELDPQVAVYWYQ